MATEWWENQDKEMHVMNENKLESMNRTKQNIMVTERKAATSCCDDEDLGSGFGGEHRGGEGMKTG